MEPISGQLILKRGREKPVHNRHPWIFSGAIHRVEGKPAPGELVHVVDGNGRYLATAYFNPHSQIRARIISWDDQQTINRDFWRLKLQRAIQSRQHLALEPATTAYRLVYGESDGLPGLIVDKYGDYLVIQALTLGIDRRLELFTELLADLLSPTGIIERSDVDVRQQEGLTEKTGVLWGKTPPSPLTIQENGLKFGVDLLGGHKTGFYLDQRDNRALLGQSHFVAGQTILNAFAYTGGFGTYAAANGAGRIVNLDSSYSALEQAEKNIALNGFDRPDDEYLQGDVFEVLRHYRDTNQQFDMVILDPPKFAHTQRDIEKASRGYKDLAWLACRILRPDGILATFSCSGRVSADLFQKIVFGAAVDAERDVQILYQMGQAPDHPIALTFPESAYLKGLLCRVF